MLVTVSKLVTRLNSYVFWRKKLMFQCLDDMNFYVMNMTKLRIFLQKHPSILVITHILKQRELYESEHVEVECGCLKI